MTSGTARRAAAKTIDLGGTHHGVVVADAVAARHDVFVTPAYRTVVLDQLAPADVRDAARAFGRGIAVRYSGGAESFSPHSRRGPRSSSVRISLEEALARPEDAVARIRAHVPREAIAVVLQEFVSQENLLRRVIGYVEEGRVLIEVHRSDGSTRLFVREPDGTASVEETRPSDDPRENSLEAVLPDVLCRLADEVDFDVDIEGFWDGRRFVLLQIRPIPQDRPSAPEGWRRLDLPGSTEWHRTRFAWGVYRATGTLHTWENSGAAGRAMCDLVPRWAEDCLPLVPDHGGPPVVVDMRRGFHLEHAAGYLPPRDADRARLSYVSLASHPETAWLRPGTRLAVDCDGRVARWRALD